MAKSKIDKLYDAIRGPEPHEFTSFSLADAEFGLLGKCAFIVNEGDKEEDDIPVALLLDAKTLKKLRELAEADEEDEDAEEDDDEDEDDDGEDEAPKGKRFKP